MLQLVYISSSRTPISDAVCEDILASSRRNNLRRDITGLLVVGQRRFLQALEGPTDAVRLTYRSIAADPRHHACVTLGERYVDARQFGDWSMGYAASDEGNAAESDLRSIIEALVHGVEDKNLRAQFMGFAEMHSRAA